MSKHPIFEKIAERYSIDPATLLQVLKSTAFRVKNTTVSDEQMVALLVVADQYGLNPFTKELFAYPDKNNGIVPVVSIDGWSRIINEHPQNNGFEFYEAEKRVKVDEEAQECPEWIAVTFYRKDRAHATTVKEYIDEVYKPRGKYPDGNKMPPSAWQTHTKRFLRHKALIQGARVTFGFAGIYDDDEAKRIIDAEITEEIEQDARAISMPRAITNNPGQVVDVTPVMVTAVQGETVQVETIDKETGEVKQEPPKAEKQAPAHVSLSPAAKNTLRQAMAGAGVNDAGMKAKTGFALDEVHFGNINDVLKKLREPAPASA